MKSEREVEARLNELCARLAVGDTRARQMQQELGALQAQLEADAN